MVINCKSNATLFKIPSTDKRSQETTKPYRCWSRQSEISSVDCRCDRQAFCLRPVPLKLIRAMSPSASSVGSTCPAGWRSLAVLSKFDKTQVVPSSAAAASLLCLQAFCRSFFLFTALQLPCFPLKLGYRSTS